MAQVKLHKIQSQSSFHIIFKSFFLATPEAIGLGQQQPALGSVFTVSTDSFIFMYIFVCFFYGPISMLSI